MKHTNTKTLNQELAKAIPVLRSATWRGHGYLAFPLTLMIFTLLTLVALRRFLDNEIEPAISNAERNIEHLHQTRGLWVGCEIDFEVYQSELENLEYLRDLVLTGSVLTLHVLFYTIALAIQQEPMETYHLEKRLNTHESIRCLKLAQQIKLPYISPRMWVSNLLPEFKLAHESTSQYLRLKDFKASQRFALISTGLFSLQGLDTQKRLYRKIFKRADLYSKPWEEDWVKIDQSGKNNRFP